MNVLESSKASLAPVIFGKWMNISGSALANYWPNVLLKKKHNSFPTSNSTENLCHFYHLFIQIQNPKLDNNI
ncbi:MAG: hypothetical protein ACYTBZ_30155, partial [Planctomycetota bacterium]|jgi:hypothetical protein